ncbi:MAG: hypothetical protein HOJ48_00725 [Desulfobacula sp.]|nr:hypothetical protein [Desulfobacula sp.]
MNPKSKTGWLKWRCTEKSCYRAAKKGIHLDERLMFELFELCQYMAFKSCGLKVSSIEPSGNRELLTLVQEAHK